MQCRRGMLELDFILHRFLNTQYEQLSPEQQAQFSRLLEEEDPTLFDWLVVGVPCGDSSLQDMVNKIVSNYY